MKAWRLNGKSIGVFGQFFASFLVLVLVPSLIACLFTYVYVVDLIEREVESSSGILIGHFSEQTDGMISRIREEMVAILESPGLKRFVHDRERPAADQVRLDRIVTLTDQLEQLGRNHALIANAHLLMPGQHTVIAGEGVFERELYYTYLNNSGGDQPDRLYDGSALIAWSGPVRIEQKGIYQNAAHDSGTYITAVMGYPFSSPEPDVLLVVNLDVAQLEQAIAIRQSGEIATAIVDRRGRTLAAAGVADIDGTALLDIYLEHAGEPAYMTLDGRRLQLSYDESTQYPWVYVSLADVRELREPAALIRRASIGLLLFLFLTGAFLSYGFSKRLYSPIREIKTRLSRSRLPAAGEDGRPEGNEFELIQRWSETMLREHSHMNRTISGMAPVMHESFVSRLLLGEFRDPLSVRYYAAEIGLDLEQDRGGRLAALCIRLDDYERGRERLSETAKTFRLTALKETIRRELPGALWQCRVSSGLLVCIVRLPDDGAEAARTASASEAAASDALRQAEALRTILDAHLEDVHATIGVGRAVEAVWELHRSYAYGLRLLRRRSLEAGAEVCADADGRGDEPAYAERFLSQDHVNEMARLHAAGQYAAMRELARRLLGHAAAGRATAEAVRQLCTDILNTWLRAIADDKRKDVDIAQFSHLFQRLHRCYTEGEIRTFVEEAADELFTERRRGAERELFAGVTAHIDAHYGDELGIEEFARQLGMSPGHFSRSFKEVVGEKYIDYVTRRRIEAAKELLRETELKLDDIAAEVGYLGRHAFIRAFRKLEGVTPGKYRSGIDGGEED
ncbi:AraC family transcriptional regulator [Paenibacillus sp. IB182496]|uniref:AraC family transcriptional regulator n=1 Tax=Paenibacillus sabuli TaxID=2772509 RepID=A0A927BRE3_9BACL|nr:helix-turn-helix domain-containing protein [Paenibacillus sabuli]MBD2844088.1 AraC family transcriptional regulator [Paenibacillus sabuli]